MLGVSNVGEYTPKRLQKLIDLKEQEKIQQFNSDMGFAWEIGRLVGLAVNNPKQYPRRPTTYKERVPQVQSKEDYIKEWRTFVEQNRQD